MKPKATRNPSAKPPISLIIPIVLPCRCQHAAHYNPSLCKPGRDLDPLDHSTLPGNLSEFEGQEHIIEPVTAPSMVRHYSSFSQYLLWTEVSKPFYHFSALPRRTYVCCARQGVNEFTGLINQKPQINRDFLRRKLVFHVALSLALLLYACR